MKMIASMTTAALTIAFLPVGCTTTGAKVHAREQPVPATTHAANAVIQIDGLSCPF